MEKEISSIREAFSQKLEENKTKEAENAVEQKNPKEILKTAADLIEDNNLEEARKLLSAYLKKHPNEAYSGVMHFYVGNSYFLEKDYKKGALDYMASYKKDPHGSKAAESLYKLALCFKRLNKNNEAKSTLDKLISDYPKSEIIAKAKKERLGLK
jgi:tol-pal system protein YbgF